MGWVGRADGYPHDGDMHMTCVYAQAMVDLVHRFQAEALLDYPWVTITDLGMTFVWTGSLFCTSGIPA